MSASPVLPAPTGVTARYQGSYNSNNTTNYYYWVQALYPGGYSALSASGNTGAHAPASLTPGNFVNVQWNPAPGAIGYVVYKSTSSTAPGYNGTVVFIATSETGYKDDGSVVASSQAPRYDGVYVARAIYNAATDSLIHATNITPAISDTIPAGAVIIGGFAKGITNLAGPTNVSVGLGASNGVLLAATGIAGLNAGLILPLIPATPATNVITTAAAPITFNFTAADVTAGVTEVVVIYVLAL